MATKLGETTAWTRRLAHVPDWALREELQRRGEEADTDQAVRLPGLTVDPVAGQVVWRGDGYVVRGRQMEVLYAIALAVAAGRRRIHCRRLAPLVWRGWEPDEAVANARVVVRDLRARIPGLLPLVVPGYYELALDPVPAVGQEGVA